MKNLNTFEDFVNESVNEAKKGFVEIAKELVVIAAKYTDANLSKEEQKSARCKTDVLVVSLYYDLLETLTDEDINPKECIAFEKECKSFLNKNGIEF
jgi:hypothetical protein